MVDIRVVHPRFQRRALAVRPAGVLGPKLLVDGVPSTREKGAYRVEDDEGRVSVVKLKGGIDPIPKVEVDGQLIQIAPNLPWYDFALAAWPFALVAVGGALGGLFGALAVTANLRIMRSSRHAGARYALALTIGVGACVAYAVLAAVFRGLVRNEQ